ALGNMTRTFSVADPAPPIGTDLGISAAITGAGGIIKTGTGHLDLTGNSSYTGATTISAGIVSIADSNALGVTSVVTIAGGAELDLSGGISVGAPITSVQGTGTTGAGAIVNTGGTNNVDLDIQATISGTGAGITVPGVSTGTLQLDGPNTFDSGVDAQAGVV